MRGPAWPDNLKRLPHLRRGSIRSDSAWPLPAPGSSPPRGIFIKLAYGAGVGPETVLALRMIIAVPIYLTIGSWLLLNPRVRSTLGLKAIAGSALVGMLGYYFLQLS